MTASIKRRLVQIRPLGRQIAEMLGGKGDQRVVIDPAREKTITHTRQQSSIDYNVFEGFKVKGLPRFTMTRGYVAIQENEVKTREGHGQFVPREPFSAPNKALSKWKALTAPRAVIRDPANMPAGV